MIQKKSDENSEKKVSEYVNSAENINYLPIKNYSWEQENKIVKYSDISF